MGTAEGAAEAAGVEGAALSGAPKAGVEHATDAMTRRTGKGARRGGDLITAIVAAAV
jgi:hypothetical protein